MYLFLSRGLVLLAITAAFSAPAQETIIFSKPADLSASKANSFLPGSIHNAGDYNAPRQLFNDYTPDLPMPEPLFQANNDPSAQAALDRARNWTLLTPEQILNIQTPEQILGIPDRTGEKNLPLDQQFLLRESRSDEETASNNLVGITRWRDTDEASPFDGKNSNDGNDDAFRQSLLKAGPGNFNPLLNAQHSGAGPDVKPDSPWTSVFAQPPLPKPTPEQVADMERFRAMLEPASSSVQKPATAGYSVPSAPAPDPDLQPEPAVNPAGRSIPPLENEFEFSRPSGISPLPPVSTPPPPPATTRPSWQAQLPPWMKTGPQAGPPSQGY